MSLSQCIVKHEMSMENVARIEATQKEQLDLHNFIKTLFKENRYLVFWLATTDDLQLCNIISQQIAEIEESLKDNEAKLTGKYNKIKTYKLFLRNDTLAL